MERIKIAPFYDKQFLEVDRPQPLSDLKTETLIKEVLNGKINKDISDDLFTNFIENITTYITDSDINQIVGLEEFPNKDIILGCTHFIDNLYMQSPCQTLLNDYKYHERLQLGQINEIGNLAKNVPLILSLPFPATGGIHPKIDDILSESLKKNIDVHIDGAWLLAAKNIDFDFAHPTIKSVGVSLSKGLSLGWNRIGIRFKKIKHNDSISIMNKYNMTNKSLIIIGLHYLKNLTRDYFWKKYGNTYYKICTDFDLTPTDSIHIALKDNNPVGLSPLIRFIHES